jgi:hypothetical protein
MLSDGRTPGDEPAVGGTPCPISISTYGAIDADPRPRRSVQLLVGGVGSG